MQKILFVPDCHFPYEDKAAFALLLKASKFLQPHFIVVLGDFVDCYTISAHSKDPRRTLRLPAEIAAARKGLQQLAATAPRARKLFIAGNHEQRLERYLCDRAPELFGLVSIEQLLDLAAMGWEFTPYKDYAKVGRLYVTHDIGNAGAQAHLKTQAAFEANTVIGHTHRIGYAVVGSARGQAHVGAMFGWLGDVKKADYMHKVKAQRDWAHGFGVGYLEPGGNVHLQPVPIVKGRCVIEGKLLR